MFLYLIFKGEVQRRQEDIEFQIFVCRRIDQASLLSRIHFDLLSLFFVYLSLTASSERM